MNAEFEEKTYETYFNFELARQYPIFFPPGQVCEGWLGFDVAFYIESATFRSYPLRRKNYLNKLLCQIQNLPKQMKANCFFQYKRPIFLANSKAKEWMYWSRPYFRYKICNRQQKLLENIKAKLNNSLVLYASPATVSMDELFHFYENSEIIDNSNFTAVERLSNHHVNTYIRSGNFSIACSEMEEIRSLNLHQQFSYFEQYVDTYENIRKVTDVISDIMTANELYGYSFNRMIDNYNLYYDPYLARHLLARHLNEVYFFDDGIMRDFYIMNVFKVLTGIQWAISY
ncbi:TPA: hypothetical protein ACFU1W_001103 [Neisseria oralis]|jgi:hypothetical protein